MIEIVEKTTETNSENSRNVFERLNGPWSSGLQARRYPQREKWSQPTWQHMSCCDRLLLELTGDIGSRSWRRPQFEDSDEQNVKHSKKYIMLEHRTKTENGKVLRAEFFLKKK